MGWLLDSEYTLLEVFPVSDRNQFYLMLLGCFAEIFCAAVTDYRAGKNNFVEDMI